MHRLLMTCVLLIALVRPAPAMTLDFVDCESPLAYLQHNGSTIFAIVNIVGGLSDAGWLTVPGGDAWTTFRSLGVNLFASKTYASVAFSPQNLVNSFLGLVCLGLVDAPDEATLEAAHPYYAPDALVGKES